MPIFDQGYQHWSGTLSGHASRWLAVTRQGVRAQMKNRWVRALIILAWIPAGLLVFATSVWGLFEQKSTLVMPLVESMQIIPAEIRAGPKMYRGAVWTMAYFFFFYVEITFAMLLVVLVGPNLVSQD